MKHINVKIVVPFRSSSNDSNIINAVNMNELYKLNKSNLIGNKQVLLRELQY